MINLYCDLDNTIIYSHRKTLNVPKRVAEFLNGAEQSYITEKTYGFLSNCRKFCFIPVTTRTFNQYERLKNLFDGIGCKHALIQNGAILITNGMIDEEWIAESQDLVKDSKSEMERTVVLLTDLGATIKHIDEFLVYASAIEPSHIAMQIKSIVDTSLLHIFFDSRKVYCVPQAISKGNAVVRLTNKLKPDITIGVGDSSNDISMLENVDFPIIPQSIQHYISNINKVVVPQGQIISDVACDEIEKILKSP